MIFFIKHIAFTIMVLLYGCTPKICLNTIENANEVIYCCDIDGYSYTYSDQSTVAMVAIELFSSAYRNSNKTDIMLNRAIAYNRFVFNNEGQTCEGQLYQLLNKEIYLTIELEQYEINSNDQDSLLRILDGLLRMGLFEY